MLCASPKGSTVLGFPFGSSLSFPPETQGTAQSTLLICVLSSLFLSSPTSVFGMKPIFFLTVPVSFTCLQRSGSLACHLNQEVYSRVRVLAHFLSARSTDTMLHLCLLLGHCCGDPEPEHAALPHMTGAQLVKTHR